MADSTSNCLTVTSTGADLHLLRNWENDSHVLRGTHYDSFDEDSAPRWSTACGGACEVELDDILWLAYADEVRDLIESLPVGKGVP